MDLTPCQTDSLEGKVPWLSFGQPYVKRFVLFF